MSQSSLWGSPKADGGIARNWVRTRFEAVCAKILVSCRKVMVIDIVEISVVSSLLSLLELGYNF